MADLVAALLSAAPPEAGPVMLWLAGRWEADAGLYLAFLVAFLVAEVAVAVKVYRWVIGRSW